MEVYPEAERKEAQRGGTTRGVATALGPRSGNDAPSSSVGVGSRKTNIQTEGSSKACKRKLVDCSDHCGSGNHPPLKKLPTRLTGKNGGAKAPSKKKLIAGQGKLTSFFRLWATHCRDEVEGSTSNVALFNQWSVVFEAECSGINCTCFPAVALGLISEALLYFLFIFSSVLSNDWQKSFWKKDHQLWCVWESVMQKSCWGNMESLRVVETQADLFDSRSVEDCPAVYLPLRQRAHRQTLLLSYMHLHYYYIINSILFRIWYTCMMVTQNWSVQ